MTLAVLTPEQVAGEAEVQERCSGILSAIHELWQYERPRHGALPQDVHSALVEVRGRLDTMEDLHGDLLAIQALVGDRVRLLEDARQAAWDGLATKPSVRGMSMDYQGKEERYAAWNLATARELRALRAGQRVADIVKAAERQASAMVASRRALLRELDTTLRYLPWQETMGGA
jgi:hypothetical protein